MSADANVTTPMVGQTTCNTTVDLHPNDDDGIPYPRAAAGLEPTFALQPFCEQDARHVRHGPPFPLGQLTERFERLGLEPDMQDFGALGHLCSVSRERTM